MGSAIGIARGKDSRNKIVVTQLRQENVRLQARIERLSAEASRLKAEINAMLKDKELLTCSINGGHLYHFSPTNGEALQMFNLLLFQGLNKSKTEIIRTLEHRCDSVKFHLPGKKNWSCSLYFSFINLLKNEDFLAIKKCMGCVVFICRS